MHLTVLWRCPKQKLEVSIFQNSSRITSVLVNTESKHYRKNILLIIYFQVLKMHEIFIIKTTELNLVSHLFRNIEQYFLRHFKVN